MHDRLTIDHHGPVEFGMFLQGYVPGPAAHTTEGEHAALLNEVEMVVAADRHNWKYVWVSEHHAPDRVLPHLRQRGLPRLLAPP